VNAPNDIPCLQSIHIESAVPLHIHVDVFGSRSQKASLVLELPDLYDARKREDISKKYLGHVCTMWPYKREVLVIAFSDMEYEYTLDKPPRKLSHKESELWNSKAETLQKKWKDTKAVKCTVSCIFTVRVARKTQKNQNQKEWIAKPEFVPFQLLTA